MNNPIPEKIQGIPWQQFESGLILLQSRSSTVHELNETAGWLWQNIDGSQNLQQLAQALAEEFEVSLEEAQADALVLINDLISKGLMKWK